MARHNYLLLLIISIYTSRWIKWQKYKFKMLLFVMWSSFTTFYSQLTLVGSVMFSVCFFVLPSVHQVKIWGQGYLPWNCGYNANFIYLFIICQFMSSFIFMVYWTYKCYSAKSVHSNVTSWLTVMKYPFHKWYRICSLRRNYNPLPFHKCDLPN